MYCNEETEISQNGQENSLEPSLLCLISSILVKICKMKGRGMTIDTAISKTVVSLLIATFVDNNDLVIGAKDAHISKDTINEQFQGLMTC